MALERIPLAQPIQTRDGTLTKDSKCVNGYFESSSGGKEFVKRPGLTIYSVSPPLPAGKGQGMYIFKDKIYLVIDNVLYKVDPLTAVSSVIGTLTGDINQCYFTQTLDNTYLFLHNQTYGYIVNGTTGAFSKITNDKVVDTIILTAGTGYLSTDTVVFSAPPSGVTATGTLQFTSGIISGITITNPGSGYVTPPTISITTSTGSGFSGTSVLSFFPAGPLTPGIAFLDSYVVVGTVLGRVYTSNPNNPTLWNPLDYISSEQEPDLSTGLCKHLNYVLDFGQWSLEFFYDNGNPVASPLSVSQSYRVEIGCANGNSIVPFEQTVMWVGVSKTAGKGVYLLDGTAPVKVSTVYIDRILENSDFTSTTAYAFKINGHTFYVLTLHDLNVTIVYDITEKEWVQWTSYALGNSTSGVPGVYAEQYFRPSYFAGKNQVYAFLDDDTGTLYAMSDNYYTDAGAPIYFRSVTSIMDNGSTKRKFYNRLEMVGDKVAATMKIRHSGDDYNTWSSYRSVNLNVIRPQVYQSGADRRRSWEFLSTDDAPIRLEAAEIDYEIGEINT